MNSRNKEKSLSELDSYELWLKKQTVNTTKSKSEVKVPLDSFEGWLRKEVQKRLESAD